MRIKIIQIFGVFLSIMLLFTFLSRAVNGTSVAKVTTKKTMSGFVDHTVSGSGRVEALRERAVSTEDGQIVKTIYVEEGQAVEKGDLLFDLDLDELEEQLLNARQELKKLKLQNQDVQSQKAAKEQQEALTRSRAAQDYQETASANADSVADAWAAYEAATKALSDYIKNGSDSEQGDSTEDTVESALLKEVADKEADLQAAKDALETLKIQIELAVQQARSQAQGSNRELEQADIQPLNPALHGAAVPETEIFETEFPKIERIETEVKQTEMRQTEMTQTDATEAPVIEIPSTEPQSMESESPKEEVPVIIDPGTSSSSGNSSVETPKEAEARVRQSYSQQKKEAEQAVQEASFALNQANTALNTYEASKNQKMENGEETERQRLLQKVQETKEAYEAAVAAQQQENKAAARQLEDASMPQGSDSSAAINDITEEQQELMIRKLEQLKEASGQVKAPVNGIVTKINIITGERTPDGTAVMMAEEAAGTKLTFLVSKEQEKYVSTGDTVNMIPSGSQDAITDYTVSAVEEETEDPGRVRITVNLPAGVLEIGTMVDAEIIKQSVNYQQTIPLEAVYEEMGRKRVGLWKEKQGGCDLLLWKWKLPVFRL